MQFVALQLGLIGDGAFAVSIHHAADKREGIGGAFAFLDGIEELRDPDVAGDAVALLLQIEIGAALGAIVHVLGDHPITCQVRRVRGGG